MFECHQCRAECARIYIFFFCHFSLYFSSFSVRFCSGFALATVNFLLLIFMESTDKSQTATATHTAQSDNIVIGCWLLGGGESSDSIFERLIQIDFQPLHMLWHSFILCVPLCVVVLCDGVHCNRCGVHHGWYMARSRLCAVPSNATAMV